MSVLLPTVFFGNSNLRRFEMRIRFSITCPSSHGAFGGCEVGLEL